MTENRGGRKDLGDKAKLGSKDPEGTFRKSNTYMDSALMPLEVSEELDKWRQNALRALDGPKSKRWQYPQLKGLEHDVIAEICREITKKADDPRISAYIDGLAADLMERAAGPPAGAPSTCTLDTSILLDINIREVAERINAPRKPDRKIIARVREAIMTASTKVAYFYFHDEGKRNKKLLRRLAMPFFFLDPRQWATTCNQEGEEGEDDRIRIRPGDALLFECKRSYTKSPGSFNAIKNLAGTPDTEMFRKLKDILERELGFRQSKARKEEERLRQKLLADAKKTGRKRLNKEDLAEIERAKWACFTYDLPKEELWQSLKHLARYTTVEANGTEYPHLGKLDKDIDDTVPGLEDIQLLLDFKRRGPEGRKEHLIFYLNPNYLEDSARKAEELIRAWEEENAPTGEEKRKRGRPAKSRK